LGLIPDPTVSGAVNEIITITIDLPTDIDYSVIVHTYYTGLLTLTQDTVLVKTW
jgi:hypothetical protein